MKKRAALLPPEASTSWLLQDFYLVNILAIFDFVIMDIEDYNRYLRLSRDSTLAFLRSFLLHLLKFNGFLVLLDYADYYDSRTCTHVLNFSRLTTDRFFRFDRSLDLPYEFASQSYRSYIDYTRNDNRKILYEQFDREHLDYFETSKRKADLQTESIIQKKYAPLQLHNYFGRLYTKFFSSYRIAKNLEKKFGWEITVFDSKEYAVVYKSIDEIFKNSQPQDFKRKTGLDYLKEFRPFDHVYHTILDQRHIENDASRSIIPLLVATIQFDKSHLEALSKEINSIPSEEVEAQVIDLYTRYLYYSKRKQQKRSFLFSFLGFFSGIFAIEAFISYFHQTYEDLKLLQDKDYLHVSKWITLAVILSEPDEIINNSYTFKRNINYWGTAFFYKVFKKPAELDIVWRTSQRIMTVWTDKSVYIPWFENPESKRHRNLQNGG